MSRSEHSLQLPGPSAGLRVGLFGGSFNPAHAGHLHVAETAMARLQLDWVWWIVAGGNPLKQPKTPFETRFHSAQALATGPRLRVTDIERQAGLIYTRDTIDLLMRRCRDTRFVWLMGSDSLDSFHLWKDWQAIAQTLPIAVVARPGSGARARFSPFARRFSNSQVPEVMATELADLDPPAWAWLSAPLNPLSSTALRKAGS